MLYILCGLPFSGKTTLAKKLIDKLGYSFVGLDEINTQWNRGGNGKAITKDEWKQTYAESFRILENLLAENKSVIYDATNFTKQQRGTLRTIAKKYVTNSKVIYINTPKDICIKRWQENKKVTTRNDVLEEDFMQVVNNFEEPTPDEKCLVYNNSINVDAWTKENLE